MPEQITPMPQTENTKARPNHAYFVEEEYLVTALVPSDTACFANSPGRIRRTLQSKKVRRVHTWCNMLEGNSRGLDLSRGDGGLLVVCGELGSLSGNALEDVVDERVQDGHGTVGDTSVGVDLLEDCKRRVRSRLRNAKRANPG